MRLYSFNVFEGIYLAVAELRASRK